MTYDSLEDLRAGQVALPVALRGLAAACERRGEGRGRRDASRATVSCRRGARQSRVADGRGTGETGVRWVVDDLDGTIGNNGRSKDAGQGRAASSSANRTRARTAKRAANASPLGRTRTIIAMGTRADDDGVSFAKKVARLYFAHGDSHQSTGIQRELDRYCAKDDTGRRQGTALVVGSDQVVDVSQ